MNILAEQLFQNPSISLASSRRLASWTAWTCPSFACSTNLLSIPPSPSPLSLSPCSLALSIMRSCPPPPLPHSPPPVSPDSVSPHSPGDRWHFAFQVMAGRCWHRRWAQVNLHWADVKGEDVETSRTIITAVAGHVSQKFHHWLTLAAVVSQISCSFPILILNKFYLD